MVERESEGALGLNLFFIRMSLCSFLSCAIVDVVVIKLHYLPQRETNVSQIYKIKWIIIKINTFMPQKNFRKLGNDSGLSSTSGFISIILSNQSSYIGPSGSKLKLHRYKRSPKILDEKKIHK